MQGGFSSEPQWTAGENEVEVSLFGLLRDLDNHIIHLLPLCYVAHTHTHIISQVRPPHWYFCYDTHSNSMNLHDDF